MKKKKIYIIAEAGVNHNGDLNKALKLVREAANAGANCVKFQTFKAENLVTKDAPKAAYQLEVTDKLESQFTMLKNLELNYVDYIKIINECDRFQIDFMSTPYNFEDIDFLEELNVKQYKIASGQLTELPFLRYVAKTGKKIFLSTGMSTLSEVFEAVEEIRNNGNNNICVLQCTTNYPSLIEDANLKCIDTIKQACNVQIGYSDHVQNNYACYAAVALGAEVIEKHFTLDVSLNGPDHSSSLDISGFKELVIGVRQVEKSLGDGHKKPTINESRNILGMKRSLVANRDILEGEIITEDMIGFKRPFNGLSPNYYDLIIGKKASVFIEKDSQFKFENIKW